MQTEKAYSECPAVFYSSENTTEVFIMIFYDDVLEKFDGYPQGTVVRVINNLLRNNVLYLNTEHDKLSISNDYLLLPDKEIEAKISRFTYMGSYSVKIALKIVNFIRTVSPFHTSNVSNLSSPKRWYVSNDVLDLIKAILVDAYNGNVNKVIFQAGMLKALFMTDENSINEIKD